jgi:hypothetical protein
MEQRFNKLTKRSKLIDKTCSGWSHVAWAQLAPGGSRTGKARQSSRQVGTKKGNDILVYTKTHSSECVFYLPISTDARKQYFF